MKALTGAGSVPRVFVQGACEGGFSEAVGGGGVVGRLRAWGLFAEQVGVGCQSEWIFSWVALLGSQPRSFKMDGVGRKLARQ